MSLRMKIAWLVFMVAGLACGLGGAGGDLAQVEKVSVSPASGSGKFTATVTYRPDRNEATVLRCAYPLGTDDSSVGWKEQAVDPNRVRPEQTWSFEFEIERPGQYTVSCYLPDGQQTASFNVIQPQVAVPPTATQSAAAPSGEFHSARLEIFSQEANTEIKPLWGCQPGLAATGPLNVLTGGVLDGQCNENLYDGAIVKQGTMTGQYDAAAGTVYFKLVTTSTVTSTSPAGQYRSDEIFEGSGTMVSAYMAQGKATFIFECKVISGDAACATTSMIGEVPFRITFFP